MQNTKEYNRNYYQKNKAAISARRKEQRRGVREYQRAYMRRRRYEQKQENIMSDDLLDELGVVEVEEEFELDDLGTTPETGELIVDVSNLSMEAYLDLPYIGSSEFFRILKGDFAFNGSTATKMGTLLHAYAESLVDPLVSAPIVEEARARKGSKDYKAQCDEHEGTEGEDYFILNGTEHKEYSQGVANMDRFDWSKILTPDTQCASEMTMVITTTQLIRLKKSSFVLTFPALTPLLTAMIGVGEGFKVRPDLFRIGEEGVEVFDYKTVASINSIHSLGSDIKKRAYWGKMAYYAICVAAHHVDDDPKKTTFSWTKLASYLVFISKKKESVQLFCVDWTVPSHSSLYEHLLAPLNSSSFSELRTKLAKVEKGVHCIIPETISNEGFVTYQTL